jgi:outer membrane protein assembly factor BamB
MNCRNNTFFAFTLACILLGVVSCRKINSAADPGVSNVPIATNASEEVSEFLHALLYQDTTPSGIGYPSYMNLRAYDKNYNKLWETKVDCALLLSMRLANGMLIVSENKSLFGIDVETGQIRWQNLNTQGYYVQLAFVNDTMYYIHADQKTYLEGALVSTGKVFMQVPLPQTGPNAGDGVIKSDTFYFQHGSPCSTVSAFDLKSNQVVWRSNCGAIGVGSIRDFAGNNLYIGHGYTVNDDKFTLASLNATNGNLNWTVPGMHRFGTYQNPSLNQTQLAAVVDSNYSTCLSGINPVDGSNTWKNFYHFSFAGPMKVDDAKIFFSGYPPERPNAYDIVGADISNGALLWRHSLPLSSDHNVRTSGLCVCSNKLYCVFQPVYSGVQSPSYDIVSLDMRTGKTVDSTRFQTAPLSYRAMGADLYIVTRTGKLISSRETQW